MDFSAYFYDILYELNVYGMFFFSCWSKFINQKWNTMWEHRQKQKKLLPQTKNRNRFQVLATYLL